jgi:hypothetical protein
MKGKSESRICKWKTVSGNRLFRHHRLDVFDQEVCNADELCKYAHWGMDFKDTNIIKPRQNNKLNIYGTVRLSESQIVTGERSLVTS